MFFTGRLFIPFAIFVIVLFLFILTSQFADRAVVQYTFASAAAVLASAGFFMSIRGLFLSRSRTFAFPALAFLFFFAMVFFTYGEGLRRSYGMRQVASEIVSSGTLPKYLRDLQLADNSKDRQSIARMIYQLHGMPVYYEAEKGSAGFYKPTERDLEEWMKLRPIMQKGLQTIVTIDVTILQFQSLIGIYAVVLFIVFTAGMIWVALTKPPMPPEKES